MTMRLEWDDELEGYIEVERPPDYPPGVWREGKDTAYVNGKLWHTHEAVLDKLDALEHQIKCMKRDTVIMQAIFNSGMRDETIQALTYESGPYDISELTVDARNFVESLIESAGKVPVETNEG